MGAGCWSVCLGVLWETILDNPEGHSECNLPDLYENEPLPLAYWDGIFYALTAEIQCGAVDNPLDTFSALRRWGPLKLSGAVGGTHPSTMASEMPTSDRTYGDTGQLLGLTPKQPDQGLLPTAMPYSELEARMMLAPGGSDAVSLFCDISDSDSRSWQRARGRIMVDPAYKDISTNNIQSDGEGSGGSRCRMLCYAFCFL
jgi:hypothetical protein